MVLLCGLANRGQAWSSREEVAKKLYPGSDRERRANALRQCIFRLRQWLGDSILQTEGDRIRLYPGKFSIDLSFEDGTEANPGQIAPGLHHDWIDEIRLAKGPRSEEARIPLMKGFTDSVRQIASYDPDAARGLFVSAANLSDHFSLEDWILITSAVRPSSDSDPHAADYYAMGAWMVYKNGLFDEAIRQANLALHCKPSRKTAISMATMLFYAAIERCDERGGVDARRLLNDLRWNDGQDAIGMCLFWNSGESHEAIAARNRMMASAHKFSRTEKLHFWLNAAYFSADVGDVSASDDALTEASSLITEQSDLASITLFHNVRAKTLLLKREAEAAQKAILQAKEASRRFGRVLQDVYVLETQSEITATLGQYEQARIEWSTFLRRRLRMGVGITDRLKRQQERVLV